MLLKGFLHLGPNQKMFFFSATISSFFTLYLLFHFVPEAIYGIMVSTTTLILSYIYITKFESYPQKWFIGEIILLILTFITVFHLPSHFIATSRITVKMEVKDDTLMKLDKLLLGWLFQDGQVSLYIDQNNIIGPHTTLGRFINNSLQIFYFFYYIIPYITMHFYSLANCGKEIIFRYRHRGAKSPTHRKIWNNTHFLFGVYLLTCVFVFFVNTLVPASSPRKYMKEKFIHPLTLSGFARYLNKKCKDDKSANSFPSGHVAEVLSIGFCFIAMKNYFVAIIVISCSTLIGLATLFLRYHYFCDIVMAVILAYLSYFINYHLGYKKYLKKMRNEVNNTRVIQIDQEAKNNLFHFRLKEETDKKDNN